MRTQSSVFSKNETLGYLLVFSPSRLTPRRVFFVWLGKYHKRTRLKMIVFTTVEVTDGLWEYATPRTFTLNLNVVEKSYSFIHF